MGGEPFYHLVILQKLNAYLQNNGRPVFYSLESFLNTDDWTGIPLIFKKVEAGQPMHHPEHDAVTNMQLGEGEKLVGKVDYAFVPNEGQPRLNAYLAIEDLEVEALAREGKLGLSTSFEAETIPETEDAEGSVRIVGTVRPNHVLLFEQNSCPNCWPNDGAALFENTKEHAEMTAPTDTETKGWIKSLYEKFCNVKDAEPEQKDPEKVNNTMENIDEIKTELAQLKNTLAQRDARIAELEAAEAKRVKDAAWDAIKNTLPQGWLTAEKEPETRSLFENNKDQFYLNLMQHKEKFGNAQAEGKTAAGCGCQKDEKAQMDNIRNAVSEATGFTIMED